MDFFVDKHVEAIIILLLMARSVTFCPLLSVRRCRLCFPITPSCISSRPIFAFKFLATILFHYLAYHPDLIILITFGERCKV